MKLRIYFRPSYAVSLLLAAAVVFWLATWKVPGGHLLIIPAAFYTTLLALSAWALWRIHILERWQSWDAPRRLLILAPHEDDCVISAGGIGARNHRLGGATRVVYLAPDETPGLAEVRAAEARDAWNISGIPASNLRHLCLLPPLRHREPQKLHAASVALRGIIDDFKPETIVAPMFEGGHVHHDMLAALLGHIVTTDDRFEVFEAPEYSPYVSINNTPHRIITLCTRWLFGIASYYGPPDGIDGRPVEKFRLDPADIDAKRRMLACFASQNARSLVATRSYSDRLVRMDRSRQWRQPFDFGRSYLRLALAARRLLPSTIANGLFPSPPGTIGREGALTDWQREWSSAGED